jgi:hypothetical protein
MSFDLWNPSLKIWDSIGTPTPKCPKWESIWQCVGSFLHSLTPRSANVTLALHF